MKRSRIVTSSLVWLAVIAGSTILGVRSTEAQEEHARQTVDLGCVVSDADAAVKFYTGAIGFKEIKGFDVPGEFAKRAGLTDQPLSIRVLVLGDDETATRLKLMEVPGVKSKPSDNSTITAQLGFSYITVAVTDMDVSVARLKKAGVKILAEGPAELPPSLAEGVYLTVVRDPDGNFVELVGPKKP